MIKIYIKKIMNKNQIKEINSVIKTRNLNDIYHLHTIKKHIIQLKKIIINNSKMMMKIMKIFLMILMMI